MRKTAQANAHVGMVGVETECPALLCVCIELPVRGHACLHVCTRLHGHVCIELPVKGHACLHAHMCVSAQASARMLQAVGMADALPWCAPRMCDDVVWRFVHQHMRLGFHPHVP